MEVVGVDTEGLGPATVIHQLGGSHRTFLE